MGAVQAGRWTHEGSDGVVVFSLGMRVNRPWAVHRWLPVFLAMPPMIAELARDPGRGHLGTSTVLGAGGPRVLQYWRSVEDLRAYAADPSGHHRPAWAAFNRRARSARGAVGIWHETHVVPPGASESVYVDMPLVGLARATGSVPVVRRGDTLRERLAGSA